MFGERTRRGTGGCGRRRRRGLGPSFISPLPTGSDAAWWACSVAAKSRTAPGSSERPPRLRQSSPELFDRPNRYSRRASPTRKTSPHATRTTAHSKPAWSRMLPLLPIRTVGIADKAELSLLYLACLLPFSYYMIYRHWGHQWPCIMLQD